MAEDQFKELLGAIKDMKDTLSKDLTSIRHTLETINSRVDRIKDDYTMYHLLQEVNAEIQSLNKKIDNTPKTSD